MRKGKIKMQNAKGKKSKKAEDQRLKAKS